PRTVRSASISAVATTALPLRPKRKCAAGCRRTGNSRWVKGLTGSARGSSWSGGTSCADLRTTSTPSDPPAGQQRTLPGASGERTSGPLQSLGQWPQIWQALLSRSGWHENCTISYQSLWFTDEDACSDRRGLMERTIEQGTEGVVRISAGRVSLEGDLDIPAGAQGVIVFAHGSGSSRHSPRNRFVAGALREAGLATLLFDLLTAEEESVDVYTGHLRFDIALLADRLSAATNWLSRQAGTAELPVGY